MFNKDKNGYSLVEALVGIALFAIISAGLVAGFTQGSFETMLSGKRLRATQLAREGIEATRNIKENSYAALVNGTYGLAAGTTWSFSGSSDTTDGFTRAIAIADAGTNRKQITSTVTWNQTATRAGSVVLNTYLTNWQRVVSVMANAFLVYGDSTVIPKYRNYTSSTNTFGAESSMVSSSSGNNFVIRTSPTKSEAIVGFVTSAGVLNVQCFNGTSWSQDWNVTVGGNASTQRFDIAYETNSGDVLVLYSRNVGTTNEMAYRTKAGSAACGAANWSAATNFDALRTAGVVQWIRLAWDRRAAQDLIAAAWVDAADDLSAAIWNGSSFTNEPAAVSDNNLQRVASSHDVGNFDLDYETLSGDVMLVWGTAVASGVNGVRYRTCTGGTSACTWNAVSTPPTFVDDATNLDLSANPNTDEMVFASVGVNQSDLQIGYWSGTTWTDTPDSSADTSCNPPVGGSKQVSTGWLINGVSTRSVVVYGDQGSNAIDWFTGNGSTFTKQTDFVPTPAPTNPNRSVDIQMNPLSKSELMYCLSDSNNDLFCKRLVMSAAAAFTWTNSDGAVLQASLPQTVNFPFSFAYWRQ
jgi:Tfp pilus assembly protein PilV